MTMSPRIRQWTSVALGLALIAVFIWGFYVVLRFFWTSFNQLNPTVAAGILAAVTTVIVSVVSVLISKHLEQRNLVLTELRGKKSLVYEELLEFIFRILNGEKMGLVPLTEAELNVRYSGITQRLIIWGSDDTVKAMNTFRRHSLNASSENKASTALMMLAVEDLFLAIRKDLGHRNKGLTTGTILGIFINDWHTLLES